MKAPLLKRSIQGCSMSTESNIGVIIYLSRRYRRSPNMVVSLRRVISLPNGSEIIFSVATIIESFFDIVILNKCSTPYQCATLFYLLCSWQ